MEQEVRMSRYMVHFSRKSFLHCVIATFANKQEAITVGETHPDTLEVGRRKGGTRNAVKRMDSKNRQQNHLPYAEQTGVGSTEHIRERK